MSTEIEKLKTLLQSKDVDFIRQGLELLDILIDDPEVMAAFSGRKMCYISDTGMPLKASNDIEFLSVDAVLGIVAMLASRGDETALSVTKIDISKYTNTIFFDYMDELVNLEELILGGNRKLTAVPKWLLSLPKLKRVSFIGSSIPFADKSEFAGYEEPLQIAFFEKLIHSYGKGHLVTEYAHIQPAVLEPFHFRVRPSRYGFETDCNKKPYGRTNINWQHQEKLFWALATIDKVKFDRIDTISAESRQMENLKKMQALKTLNLSVLSSHPEIDISDLGTLENATISGSPKEVVLVNGIKSLTVSNWDIAVLEKVIVNGQEYSDLGLALSACSSLEEVSLNRLMNYQPPGIEEMAQFSTVIKRSFLHWSMGYNSTNIDTALRLFDAFPEELLKPYFGTFSVRKQEKDTAFGCTIHFSATSDFKMPRIYSKQLRDQMFARLVTLGDPKALEAKKLHCVAKDVDLHSLNHNLENLYIEAKEDAIDLSKSKIKSVKIKGHRVKEERTNYSVYYRPTLKTLRLPDEITEVSIESVVIDETFLSQIPADITSLNLSNIKWKKIPDLSRFTKLETLKLINCKLSKVNFLPPTLKTLYLSSNPLQKLPEALFQCRNLENLWISNIGLTALPPEIVQLQKLKHLVSCKNDIVKGTEYLADLPQLESLRIGSQSGWNSPVVILVKKIPSLKHLSLYQGVGLNNVAFKDQELETLDVQDSPNHFALRAMRTCAKIQYLVGYMPQRTMLRGQEEDLGIAHKKRKTAGRYGTSGYYGASNLNEAFAQGVDKFNRLSKK